MPRLFCPEPSFQEPVRFSTYLIHPTSFMSLILVIVFTGLGLLALLFIVHEEEILRLYS